jgi:REP element-mobilizing transposase RayT
LKLENGLDERSAFEDERGMARSLRIELAGGCYHVINRGNYRRDLFGEKGTAESFERTLAQAAERFGWRVHAYVVMRNHFHLAVELGEPNLSMGMKWLQGTWVRRYNGFRRLVGRPFQGRYKALLVEAGHAMAQVCHYIHLNPVRARLVEPAQVAGYPWSSLPRFAAGNRPAWMEARTILTESGGLADTPDGWGQYREYLEFLATDEPARRELVAARLSRGWAVGSEDFRNEMRQEAARHGLEMEQERFGGVEPEHVQAERVIGWEARLRGFASLAGVDLGQLPPLKSAPEKVLLAAAMKRRTSVSNGWLAQRLGMGQPASVSQFVGNWERDPSRKQEVERLLSTIKT